MVKNPGTANWSKAETDHLLSIIEDVLPISPADWEDIKVRHDAKFGIKQRTVSALQRKFTTLHRTKEPTGNPNIPSPVLSAKRIRNMIDKKCDGTRGSANSSNEHGDDGDDDLSEILSNNHNAVTDTLTPLTRNAVYELSHLGGHAEKPFFEPNVQIIHLKKKAGSELYDVVLSDGIAYMNGTCAQQVSALADEEYFTLFSIVKVQEFATVTLANGTRSCELISIENTMIPNTGEKIGNPIDIAQPIVPHLPPATFRLRSPVPTSIEFGRSLSRMRLGSAKKTSGNSGSGKDDFNNIMHMMLMQQQADREQRMADREHRNFLAEQEKLEHNERAHQ